MQISTQASRKTIYFNFDSDSITEYNVMEDISFGVEYNFTVIPLPTGKPITYIAHAPSKFPI